MQPNSQSSLADWLRYIESIHPVEIELGLDRLRSVADRVLAPSESRPFVFTVAGTNGKGTTTAALAALAQSAGASVGWYTSPHLFHFNERIRINGKDVDDQSLVEAFDTIERHRGEISLSYFEYTTLAAFLVFSRRSLDVWVLEVGLGGRLDAVNLIDADVCVITTIGLDHQAFLGPTLDSIGYEKAGICRPDTPVVLGSSELPEGLYNEVHRRKAIGYRFGEKHGTRGCIGFWGEQSVDLKTVQIPIDNAVTALQAFSLSPFQLKPLDAVSALSHIQMAGRMQEKLWQGRKVVIDVGHNAHAARYIAQQLATRHGKVHAVIGMLSDKDSADFISALLPVLSGLTVIGLPVPRGLSADQLLSRIGSLPVPVESYDTLAEALGAISATKDITTLFIGGSFYTVCDALSLLEN